MAELRRITTEFIDIEDRIRLAGEVAPGQTVVLWLTQRLLGRLLPHLVGWLEQQTGNDVRGEILQGFAQQAAMAALEPQAPVPGQPHDRGWLVHSVDIATGRDGLRLTFKTGAPGESGEPFSLTLQAQPLRQWLNILYDQYRKGEWPQASWPAWLTEARPPQAGRPTALLH